MFREELERTGVPNIERMLQRGFYNWFRNHVSSMDIHISCYFSRCHFPDLLLIYLSIVIDFYVAK
jgi:hypothetical protein